MIIPHWGTFEAFMEHQNIAVRKIIRAFIIIATETFLGRLMSI